LEPVARDMPCRCATPLHRFRGRLPGAHSPECCTRAVPRCPVRDGISHTPTPIHNDHIHMRYTCGSANVRAIYAFGTLICTIWRPHPAQRGRRTTNRDACASLACAAYTTVQGTFRPPPRTPRVRAIPLRRMSRVPRVLPETLTTDRSLTGCIEIPATILSKSCHYPATILSSSGHTILTTIAHRRTGQFQQTRLDTPHHINTRRQQYQSQSSSTGSVSGVVPA